MTKKRHLTWLAPLVLALVILGWWVASRYTQKTATQPDVTNPDAGKIHDPQAAENMTKGILSLGYEDEGFSGPDWRGPSCTVHSYIVFPEHQPAVLLIRDLNTQKFQAIPVAEAERQLHRFISFEGEFGGESVNLDNGAEYWWIGVVPGEKNRRDVYVHFDKTACGFVVDKALYRGPLGDDQFIPLDIHLEPISGWKLN